MNMLRIINKLPVKHLMTSRFCHHNSVNDQMFYNMYTGETHSVVEPKPIPNPLEGTSINDTDSSDTWENSHVYKTMLEGEKDDLFLL